MSLTREQTLYKLLFKNEYDQAEYSTLQEAIDNEIDHVYDFQYEAADGTYIVADDHELTALATESLQQYIDEAGALAFSPEMNQAILDDMIDDQWFEDAERESHESYYNDLDPQEQLDTGFDNPDDYADESMSEDSIEWFSDNFGEQALKDAVIANDLVDTDRVIEHVIYLDGAANIIAPDYGEETVSGSNFDVYRID